MTDEILSKAVIQKALIKAVKTVMVEAFRKLRRKLKETETVDDVIDGVIPEKYSGYERTWIMKEVKKRLKENGSIK